MAGGDGVHVDPGRERADFVDGDLRIVHEIRLVEHDHGRRAALPCDDEIAFEAARIEVVIEAADEEDSVDVGGDDLLLSGIAGGAP